MTDSLEALSRRLRLTQAAFVAVVMVGICILGMSATQDPKSTASAQPGLIKATRFDLVDSKDRVRGSWEVAEDGTGGSPLLSLWDRDGSSRIAMSVVAGMPVISVNGAVKEDKVLRERILVTIGQDGKPDIRMFDTGGVLRAQLSLEEDGDVFLNLQDKEGKSIFRAPTGR